ncbi:MAG: hypothetical protein ABIL06_06520 [Pseudomonadota bacterium]
MDRAITVEEYKVPGPFELKNKHISIAQSNRKKGCLTLIRFFLTCLLLLIFFASAAPAAELPLVWIVYR